MNILVLMAGRGQRFINEGYDIPKPMIEVNGKTILQWTTESCPYINHTGTGQDQSIKLHFAVLQEHLDNGLDELLYSIYGSNIEIIPFNQVTKGSLDTAMQASVLMKNRECPLLVLDSDNKYDDNNFQEFVNQLTSKDDVVAVACFDEHEKTLPNKWSNVNVHNGIAKGIREKDDAWIEYPAIIGIFYFGKTQFFSDYAKFIIDFHKPIEFNGSKEYYMSMAPSYSIDTNVPVYVHTVKNVVPLGVPTDIKKFERYP